MWHQRVMKLKVREIKGKPSTPWMVAVPKIVTGTKRVRKFFRTRDDALDYISRVYSLGYVKADWRENPSEVGKATLAQCVSQFLLPALRTFDTNRQPHLGAGASNPEQPHQPLRQRSDRLPHTSGDRDVAAWHQQGSGKTRANYYRIAKRFFKWAHEKEEFILLNPMIKVDEPRVPHEEPEVLTAEQMHSASTPQWTWIVLSSPISVWEALPVSALRILRMNWEDINWVDGHIGVLKPKQVTRWRPRNVTMLPAFRRHLEAFALKEGPIFPKGAPQLFELRNQLAKALGLLDWPDNCLRHSFATYHVPIHNDYPKLLIQMGTRTQT